MATAFIDHLPTREEMEKIRLVLSTYQDGSGQHPSKAGLTLPGWRDFERSVAAALGGIAQESKFIFDVLIPDPSRLGFFFGLSCKMRRTLNETRKTGQVTLELSNSAGKFWNALNAYDLYQQNYKSNPSLVGKALIDLVNIWHEAVSIGKGGMVDLTKSFYLALSWNKQGEYQLFQFPLSLPKPENLEWDFPVVQVSEGKKTGRRLRGRDSEGVIFEWYGESGAQLKYYPRVVDAIWRSDIFTLEPLPEENSSKYGVLAKARAYFPKRWIELSINSKG